MPKGIGLQLYARHTNAVRFRLQGLTLAEVAEELGLSGSFGAARSRLNNARLRMERSVRILTHATRIGYEPIAERRRRRLIQMANAYSGLIEYGDLDAFYWLRELTLALGSGMASEKGALLREEEIELLERRYDGQSFAEISQSMGEGDPKHQRKLWMVMDRLRKKLEDCAANFVKLHSCAPEPREGVNILFNHSNEIIEWGEITFEVDPFELVGRALQGVWLQELGLRRQKDREEMATFLRGEVGEFSKSAIAKEYEVPEYIVEVVDWR